MNPHVIQNNLNFHDNLVAQKIAFSKGEKESSSSKPKFTDDFRGLKLDRPIPDAIKNNLCKFIDNIGNDSDFDLRDPSYRSLFQSYKVMGTEPCYVNIPNSKSAFLDFNGSEISNIFKQKEAGYICNLPDLGGKKCFAVAVRNNMLIGIYDKSDYAYATRWYELKASLISKYGQPSGSDSGNCPNRYGVTTEVWERVWWWVNGSSLQYQSGCTSNYLLIKSKIINEQDKKQDEEQQRLKEQRRVENLKRAVCCRPQLPIPLRGYSDD